MHINEQKNQKTNNLIHSGCWFPTEIFN